MNRVATVTVAAVLAPTGDCPIYSKHHLLISLAVGAVAVVLSPVPPSLPAWVLLAWAALVGVGIDIDHLVVARLNAGDWSALRGVLHDPAVAVLDQDAVFAEDDLWARQRLLSHHVVGGILVAVLVPASAFLAAYTALVLYAHVVADLVHDNRRLERDFRRHARSLESVDE